MTRRSRRSRAKAPLSAESLPALADFAVGYLHQDLEAEYGSAAEALTAFRGDATPEELQALSNDLATIASAARRWSPEEAQRFFRRELRSAWTPDDVEAIETLAKLAAAKP